MTTAAPERDLLLACAVWNASAAELDRVRERARRVADWDAWLQLTRMHKLVPHAQRALSDAVADVPADIAHELAVEARAVAARALSRAQQLAELMRLLDRADVPALAFKGPVLSLAAYGSAGVRDSSDLDIVVRPRDVDGARSALQSGGYSSRTDMSPAQERMLQRSFGHFSYSRDGAPAVVELHWRFAAPRYPWSMPAAEVFARARSVDLAGAAMRAVEPTDDVLLQAMHGARHQWERLEWLVAFGQLLRNDAVDHRALVERARANGSARALAVGLRLLHDLLGDPFAPGLAPNLAPIAADGAAAELATEIRSAIDWAMESSESPTDEPYALNLRMMERGGDRARYIALSVFAPTVREWELVRLPGFLLPLYYPLRFARVVALRMLRLFVRR